MLFSLARLRDLENTIFQMRAPILRVRTEVHTKIPKYFQHLKRRYEKGKRTSASPHLSNYFQLPRVRVSQFTKVIVCLPTYRSFKPHHG